MRRLAPLAVILATGLAACSSAKPYTPTSRLPPVETAKQTIERCLVEQPGTYAAADITITEEKLTFATQVRRLIGASSGPAITTFYFDSLGKMDLIKHKVGNIVRVWDKSGVFRFRVVIPDPIRAQSFMDAMASFGARARSDGSVGKLVEKEERRHHPES